MKITKGPSVGWRIFCFLTFGHCWVARYGYGCPLSADYDVCIKCEATRK